MRINKKALIMEIVNPVMEEMGLELVCCKTGEWKWEKEIIGSKEYVEIMDFDGRISLVIGNQKGQKYKQGEALLRTIDNPRTTWWDWTYKDKSDASNREELYRNILFDFRDILQVNCESILNENAITVKNRVPNSKHFKLLCDVSLENVKAKYEELIMEVKDELDAVQLLMSKAAGMHEDSVEQVEEMLVLYAAVIVYIIMKQDGVRKKVDYEYQTLVVSKYDKRGYVGHSTNVLLDIFGIWKNPEKLSGEQRAVKAFFE